MGVSTFSLINFSSGVGKKEGMKTRTKDVVPRSAVLKSDIMMLQLKLDKLQIRFGITPSLSGQKPEKVAVEIQQIIVAVRVYFLCLDVFYGL